ncbi:MAG: hypothetical protein M3Z54_15125 [Gemmatimonadota bacterium]|nr:hypothetical protein [Gemmatimonadota bacterium]
MGQWNEEDYWEDPEEEKLPDLVEEQAVTELRTYFDTSKDRVFTSRQIEILFEDKYFHWITHRALKRLTEEGSLVLVQRQLSYGAPINLVWHRSKRYTTREVSELISLVEQYADPDFTAALGNTGELLVSDGFSRFGFGQRARNANSFKSKKWERTDQNLDFIFERDARVYGVEVKNTLSYITAAELDAKLELSRYLDIVPVFVVRQMPRIWIQKVARVGGFTLILKYHLYPLSHKALAEKVRSVMGLPVDAPKALYDGTIQRFLNWHERQLA